MPCPRLVFFATVLFCGAVNAAIFTDKDYISLSNGKKLMLADLAKSPLGMDDSGKEVPSCCVWMKNIDSSVRAVGLSTSNAFLAQSSYCGETFTSSQYPVTFFFVWVCGCKNSTCGNVKGERRLLKEGDKCGNFTNAEQRDDVVCPSDTRCTRTSCTALTCDRQASSPDLSACPKLPAPPPCTFPGDGKCDYSKGLCCGGNHVSCIAGRCLSSFPPSATEPTQDVTSGCTLKTPCK